MKQDGRVKWTTEQIDYLCQAYPQNVSIDLLAQHLGKHPTAIWTKARRLGLSRTVEMLPEGYKRCPDCKEIKAIDDEFWSNQSTCKPCLKRRRVEWGNRRREYLRHYMKKLRRTSIKIQLSQARGVHKSRGLVKEGHDLTAEEWMEILARFGGICPACGEPFTADNPATRDCIVPLTLGGTLTKSNVQPLHNKCNNSKHSQVIRYEPVSMAGRGRTL